MAKYLLCKESWCLGIPGFYGADAECTVTPGFYGVNAECTVSSKAFPALHCMPAGKRYARTDEIGVPFALTVDYETCENNTVTVRERDSMNQVGSRGKSGMHSATLG